MIPMLDLDKEFQDIKEEVFETVTKIFSSSRFILGPYVEEFEKKIALYHDLNYGIGLASGTDALTISLAALGIREGCEVITTPFTFFATVESIIHQNATPLFVDIDEKTLNIDPEKIEEKITEKTKAILPVHIFGLPCNMPSLMYLAKKYGLFIIEDCAQSFGASIDDIKVGTFGDLGCFSFYPSKNLGCYGDGGAVITDNIDLDYKIRSLRNHGSNGGYLHKEIGFNSRLDEIQAGILLIRLKRVERLNELRRKNASIYTSLLKDYVTCQVEPEGYKSVYNLFTIRSSQRDKIQDALKREGISSVIYYPVPMHLQEALNGYGYRKGDFPVSEKVSSEVLSLPIYPTMSEKDIERVSDVIIKCL